jgi:hypothetical protein
VLCSGLDQEHICARGCREDGPQLALSHSKVRELVATLAPCLRMLPQPGVAESVESVWSVIWAPLHERHHKVSCCWGTSSELRHLEARILRGGHCVIPKLGADRARDGLAASKHYKEEDSEGIHVHLRRVPVTPARTPSHKLPRAETTSSAPNCMLFK